MISSWSCVRTGSGSDRIINSTLKGPCSVIFKSRADPVATAPGSESRRPNEICRDAQKHDSKAYSAVKRKLVEQAERDNTTSCNKEKRGERMTGHPEDLLVRWVLFSKRENTHRRQRKEHHIDGDYIVQDLFEAARHQGNHNCEPALQRNRDGGNARAIQPRELFEK